MKKKGLKPAVAFIILALVAALSFGGGFFVLNSQKSELKALEAAMPESALSAYLTQIRNGDYEEAYNNSQIIDPHLNSKEAYVSVLKDIYDGVEVNKVIFEVSPTDPQMYDLFYDNRQIASVKLVKDGDTWRASTQFKGDNEYIVEVPEGMTLTVNGIEVGDEYLKEAGKDADNFRGLKEKIDKPQVDRYVLSNLIEMPTFDLPAGYGVLKDSLTNVYYIGEKSTDSDDMQIFMNAAQTLAKFPAMDASLGQVQALCFTNSDFYDRIRTMDNQWFKAHNVAQFSNVKCSEVIKQADNTMLANVTYDFYIAAGDVDRTYYGGLQLTFLNNGSGYRIANVVVDNQLNERNPLNTMNN
ncbi:MAG: hypothetical protein HUJ57_06800 [Erysipelotrichaceae bacterium]|nr:hypothetical protein [Erysipelotrichaceae bacterium]